MSRLAHVRGRRTFDNAPAMAADRDVALARAEEALLEGCARELTLEVRRLRLERRLRDLAAAGASAEVSRLARLLARVERQLTAQRRVVASLRGRQRGLQPG
jgi:hypothetical protein